MNRPLFDIYNSLKSQYIEAIEPYLNINRGKIVFTPNILIFFPRTNKDYYEEITEIEFDKVENTWYVHNYITDTELQTDECWTPLRDMTFDELFKIAERL